MSQLPAVMPIVWAQESFYHDVIKFFKEKLAHNQVLIKSVVVSKVEKLPVDWLINNAFTKQTLSIIIIVIIIVKQKKRLLLLLLLPLLQQTNIEKVIQFRVMGEVCKSLPRFFLLLFWTIHIMASFAERQSFLIIRHISTLLIRKQRYKWID